MADADVLYDNFRDDISCEILQKFNTYGVHLKDLLILAKKVPVVYHPENIFHYHQSISPALSLNSARATQKPT